MPVSTFVESLRSIGPETEQLIAEQLHDQSGELLLHLLVADTLRLTVAAFERGDALAIRGLLEVMESGLATGDDEVQNAVAVSFVENIGGWDPQMSAFVAVLPSALAAELARQRSIR